MIVIRDLGVNYGAKGHGRFAVRGVSFSFGTGISFGLSGQSGSGKSTVLHSIAGLIGNWEGTIEIDGGRSSMKCSVVVTETDGVPIASITISVIEKGMVVLNGTQQMHIGNLA